MAFPEEFIAQIEPLLKNEMSAFLASMEKDAPVSIRLNPWKMEGNPLVPAQTFTPVPWTNYGYYLPHRPAFTFDPLFHTGYYYVQEAASMFVEHVARRLIKSPITCLDLCAAPGGKSLALMAALPEGSLLVSNEIVRSRANILAETVVKSGNPNLFVANNAPSDFAGLPHFFDMILVDAPCSGEGMFRKDEGAVREWSPANVQMCAARQRDILSDVWRALKPGGYLVYSTCTFNRDENEENALWIARELDAEFVAIDVEPAWNITSAFDDEAIGFRFFPHKTEGEGFFITILRKISSEKDTTTSSKKSKSKPLPLLNSCESVAPYLKKMECFRFFEENSRVTALPEHHHEKMLLLHNRLKGMTFGIELGGFKGRHFIPSHALAMSTALHANAFPRYSLSYDEAIAYLRGESLTLTNVAKEFVLLTYRSVPLGLVKNVGSRANNLYPNAWRIRSRNIPESANFPF